MDPQSSFADPDPAVFFNVNPDPAAFLMRIRIRLLKNCNKLLYEDFAGVKTDKKYC